MTLDWFGEFFATLPAALRELYEFGDPSQRGQGWWGLVIFVVWAVVFTLVPLLIARATYGKREWVSATMGVVAGLSIFWWIFGILPSAWIYFLDASSELLSGPIIPASVGITLPNGYRLDLMSNFYQVVRDTVVVLEHLVAFVLVIWGAIRLQRRFPRTLATGETRPESGGYK